MSYLYGKVTDKFSFLPTDCGLETDGDRTTLVFRSEKKYCPYIRNYTEENIADVIAVGYKYQYFSKNLFLPAPVGGRKGYIDHRSGRGGPSRGQRIYQKTNPRL